MTVDPVPVEIERGCSSGSVMDAPGGAVAIDLQGISVLVARGAEVSERLDVVPVQLRVLVTRRPRYGCRDCDESA